MALRDVEDYGTGGYHGVMIPSMYVEGDGTKGCDIQSVFFFNTHTHRSFRRPR